MWTTPIVSILEYACDNAWGKWFGLLMLGLGHTPTQVITSRASYLMGGSFPQSQTYRAMSELSLLHGDRCNFFALPVLERDGAGIVFLSR